MVGVGFNQHKNKLTNIWHCIMIVRHIIIAINRILSQHRLSSLLQPGFFVLAGIEYHTIQPANTGQHTSFAHLEDGA